MNKFIYLLFLLLFHTDKSFTQESDTTCSLLKFIQKNIDLRRSFENNIDKEKPAELNFQIPDEEDPFYSIRAALSLKRIWGNEGKFKKFILDPNVEWNKNSQIDKEQNNLCAGLDFQALFLPKIIRGKPDPPTHYVSAGLKYNKNFIDSVESMRVRVQYSLLFTNSKQRSTYFQWLLPIKDRTKILGIDELGISSDYYTGLEFQNNFQAESDSLKGIIGRFFVNINARVFILDETFNSKFFVGLGWEPRFQLVNTTDKSYDSYISYLSCSFNIIPIKLSNGKGIEEPIILSFERINGANPWTGLEKQKFWKFAIKIKI